MIHYRIDYDSMPWESQAPGIQYKVCQHDGTQLRLLQLGRELKHPDWCTKGHIGYVLNGELEITFADRPIRYKAGDGLFIPSGEEHKHKPKAVTESATLILVEEV